MELRRGLLMGMASGNNLLWKTVVLEEDRKTDATATTDRWFVFLGIDSQTDLDNYVYLALFSNNTQNTYGANMIAWTNGSGGTVKKVNARQDWAIANTSNASMYANAGTRIDIYKLPNYNT